MTALLSVLLYGGSAASALLAARWLGRPVRGLVLVGVLLLPVVFLLPAFLPVRTVFPVDHAASFPPWHATGGAPANPNLNDAATQFGPWAKAVRMAWKEGSLPWRNRWNAGGSPLAANGQSAAFSPLTFLMMALPLADAFDFAVAWKLFLALTGTWLWLSELGLSRSASFAGAVLFAFSFAMTPWLLFPHTSVIALWPWALFAIERLRDRSVRARATAALVVILLLELLGGHPESVALGALFTGLWLATRAVAGDLEGPIPVFAGAALAALLASGLAAFLLVPQVLAIRDSNRAVIAEDFSNRLPRSWSPHGPLPFGAFPLVLPRALGDAIATPMLPGTPASFPEISQGHFGVLGLACALLAFRRGSRRKKAELAFIVPVVLGLATAILLWPVFEIFFALPAIRLMMPMRFFTWVALGGAALAAFELDRLQRDVAGRRFAGFALVASAAIILATAAAIFVRLRPLHVAAGSLTSQERALAGSAVILAVAAAIGILLASSRLAARPAAAIAALAILAAGELFWQGLRLYRFGSPAGLFPSTPLVRFLRAQPAPFRIVGEGAALFPGTQVFAELEDIRTHDPVERRDYVEFLDAACGYDPAAYFKIVRSLDCAAFDFLNVKYLVTPPNRPPPGSRWRPVYSGADGTVFENASVRPRVVSVGGPEVAVSGYRETTNSVVFRALAPPGGAAVLASLVQDGGWTARDETGATLPTRRANGPFLRIALPGGEHEIRLRYRPPGLATGVAVSLTTLLTILVGIAWSRPRL